MDHVYFMGNARQVFSFRRNWPAWLLLAAGLPLTALVTVNTKLDADMDAERDLDYACDEITLRIGARMEAHAQILRSGAALFYASDDVTRHEWRTYTARQKVAENLPGIQGIGFSKVIRPEELASHVASVRAEGFPYYSVTPPGTREMYTAIVFLEPFDARNRRAFGYDMYSEPTRRKAMDQACDEDIAALSGRVTLLQETNTDVQAGTLMYVPVYRSDLKSNSVQDRRAALQGWVYSPYRMKDLMIGILRGEESETRHISRMQVYDRADLSEASLMYDSAPKASSTIENYDGMIYITKMNFNGNTWFIRFFGKGYSSRFKSMYVVALAGIIISFLLFGMVSSLQIAGQKARQLAEQLKVEAGLEALNQQLQKNESLHRMAGAIAHHFNNKLGAVIGNLDLAMEDLPSGSPLTGMLAAAVQAAAGAAEISAKMLTYLGQSSGVRRPGDLSRIVQGALPLIQTVAPKNIELRVDLPPHGPTVCVDRDQIGQVLTNLTTNAFEAADNKPGRVSILVKEMPASAVPAENRFPLDWQPSASSYAVVEVADTAGGIAKDDLNKLFDPFFSSRFTGRGLGLAAVLGITRAHGGAVTVESVHGVGSLFRVFLPISDERVSTTPVLEAESAVKENDTTETGAAVLLVEDETPLREAADAILCRLGYKVLSAADGEEAVTLFKRNASEIRVVLCDLSMPRMDGWKTMDALRRIRPDIPVVLTSGHIESHAMAGRENEEPQLFLHKPYRREALRAVLEKAMSESRAR